MDNEFYLWNLRLQPHSKPLSWMPPEPHAALEQDDCGEYFGQVLAVMQQHLKTGGLTFYFTRDVQQLPSYGPQVVAIVVGDEWSRIPRYSHRVRAVFKCYGTHLTLGCSLLPPSALAIASLLQFSKAKLSNLPTWLATIRQSPAIYAIPLGYSNQLDLPIRPIEQRSYDVFFAGSIVHRSYPIWAPQHWLATPKRLSRQQMLTVMAQLQTENPGLSIKWLTTAGFHSSYSDAGLKDAGLKETESATHYSTHMMNAKICLVPRGTSLETFRFFEALRYGCIPITEALPSRYFYDGSPAITVKSWRELPQILPHLLSDPELLQCKHQQVLQWWQEKCSEQAVGRYIARQINHHIYANCIYPINNP